MQPEVRCRSQKRPFLRRDRGPEALRSAPRPCVLSRNFIPSFRNDYQTLEIMLVDQAALEAELDALNALARMPSKSLGSISLTLELVLSRRRSCAVLGG